MKKTHFDTISIVVCILSLLVFFIKYDAIPAGIHYDQMRIIVDNQYITYGWITNLPWRQFVYYWLHGGPLLSYMADLARLTGNYILLSTLPKLITIIYFYLGVFALDSILRALNLTKFQRIIFYTIFVPSAFTILLSKYIPHVASYFFFTLLAIRIALNIAQSEKFSWKDSILWLIVLVLGSCTHILSIVAITAASFFTVLFAQSKNIKQKIIKLLLFVLLGGGVYLASMYAGDSTLLGREILTSVQLFMRGEYIKAINIAIQTLSVYLSPAFLVTGGYISNQGVASAPDAWNMIKNPDMNQWLVNGLSAFGFISALVYLFPVIFWSEKKEVNKSVTYDPKIFGLVLLLSYFATAVIGIYDNPSLAKLAPLMIVVPFVVMLVITSLVQNKRILQYGAFGMVILNAVWNLYFMWGGTYDQRESKKFDHTYEAVSAYISKRFDYANDRIYLADRRWGYYTALEYYLGPSMLNRVTPITSPHELINLLGKEGHNWIITTEDNYTNVLDAKVYDKITSSEGYLPLTLYAPKDSTDSENHIVCRKVVETGEKLDAFDINPIPRLLSRPQVMNNVRYFNALKFDNYAINNPFGYETGDNSQFELPGYGDRTIVFDKETKQGSLELPIPNTNQPRILTLSFVAQSKGSISTMIDIVNKNTGESLVGSRYINFNGQQSLSFLQKPEQHVVLNIYAGFTDPLLTFDSTKYGVSFRNISLKYRSYSDTVTVYMGSDLEFRSYTDHLTESITGMPSGTYACNISYSPKITVKGDGNAKIDTANVNGASLWISLPRDQKKVVFSVSL